MLYFIAVMSHASSSSGGSLPIRTLATRLPQYDGNSTHSSDRIASVEFLIASISVANRTSTVAHLTLYYGCIFYRPQENE
uniref:Uncharacterized protein n=1 Tax=Octopus bimaculoides TaxID=37653 RepID=A0A0L8HT02_OCTBM